LDQVNQTPKANQILKANQTPKANQILKANHKNQQLRPLLQMHHRHPK
jgi:hypothetical protein